MLCVLGIVLVYALMIADVEEKTYEFGMLRTLGMKKASLLWMLLIQVPIDPEPSGTE